MSSPEPRRITYRAAVIEALAEEMRRDPAVILLGEDIGRAGGVFRQTEGLFEEFGAARVMDTPISEAGAFGIAVGAAMAGLKPVFEVMFADFMTLVMDQLVNQAAKVAYMSGGAMSVPLVLRTTMGTGASLGPQHSQSPYAWACHVPGLKVLAPSDAGDAKGLMIAAIRDPNPVLVFEDRLLHTRPGQVGEGPLPIGRAAVKRPGRDVTIVAVGRMVALALDAAGMLATDGIEAEVVDPRSLVPLDAEALAASVRLTHRALVVDGGARSYGASAEIAATLSDIAFDWLDAPVGRLAGSDTPIPLARSLEPLAQPDAARIAAAARRLVRGG